MKTELRAKEKVVLTLRKHWLTLMAPIFWIIILLLISLIGAQSEYGNFFLIGGGVSILWLIYKIIDRKNNIWIVTNFRVIDEYGVFSINSKESPLDKINNVSYRQSLIGRIFSFGDVQIQTAAERGSTLHKMVEKPKLLKDTITNCQDEYRQDQIREQAVNLASVVGGGQPTKKTDIFEQLTKLHGLKENGIITEDEFNQRKAKILAS
jgi:uncharacterized membrane protein YdbT with pleckstrin-like domain